MKKWKGRFFFIDRRAIPDAMCWRHHDSDISDPAPKDGFDEDDVIALTNHPIDFRDIPSGLLFSAGLAITWEFPKFRVLGNRDGNFDDDVDEEVDLEGPDRHVSDTTERVVIGTELIPTAATRPDNGKSVAQEETPMPDPLPKGCRDAGSSLPPFSFCLIGESPKGVVRDYSEDFFPTWFSLARGAMAQAHALSQFESLYDNHHALQESFEATIENSARRRKHCPVFELKNRESQLAQKDSALVYAERVSGERLSENEKLRAQLVFAQKEKTDAIRKLLPTVVELSTEAINNKQEVSRSFHLRPPRLKGAKMSAEYERLFSKTYSYVDRISHLSEKSVQDLLKLHPAPPPRDAPKVGSGGIVFAPKLVKAAEVARSKDTTSLSRSYFQACFRRFPSFSLKEDLAL
ncbi:hypothetical protein Tco_0667129 [Tanacetum coccineum]